MKESESREQAILRAAEHEFLTRGYDGAKTTAIAEAAGVNHALLHYYFRTKEKLFETVVANLIAELETSIIEAFSAEGETFTTRLEKGFRRHFLFLLDHPDLPRFFLNEFALHPERATALRDRVVQLAGRALVSLQAAMQRQVERGEIARVSLADLLLDAASLNVFVFLTYPITGHLLAPHLDRRAFFMARLEENITVLRKRLQPDSPCVSSSSPCSPQ